MNDLFLRTLRCEPLDRVPIWLMRQAGRYMAEYRLIREKYSFYEMVHHPELIAEITQQPIQAFDMDAAILFSDILVVCEAFGISFHIAEGVGPVMKRTVRSAEEVGALSCLDVDEVFDPIVRGIKLLVSELQVPLIGFCGGPFTVASYLIEGQSSRDLRRTKQLLFRDPKSFHLLLEKITEASIAYLRLQIDAGVSAVQIFDSWAHVLAGPQFREFSLKYLQKIVDEIRMHKIPVIIFCRGTSVFAQELAKIDPSAISFDWSCDLKKMKMEVPSHIALQGNLDPDTLYAPPSVIIDETKRLLMSMKDRPGYIFNLGHGIKPDMSPEAIKMLVDYVKGWRL